MYVVLVVNDTIVVRRHVIKNLFIFESKDV